MARKGGGKFWKYPVVYVTVKKPKNRKAKTTIEVLTAKGTIVKDGKKLGKTRTKKIKKKAKTIGELLGTYYK